MNETKNNEPKKFWIITTKDGQKSNEKFLSYKAAVTAAYDLKESYAGRVFILGTVGYVDNKRSETHKHKSKTS